METFVAKNDVISIMKLFYQVQIWWPGTIDSESYETNKKTEVYIFVESMS